MRSYCDKCGQPIQQTLIEKHEQERLNAEAQQKLQIMFDAHINAAILLPQAKPKRAKRRTKAVVRKKSGSKR